jgi:peptidoglycan/xylan/chitin deacetylase (PgdA/CDA1 family)
VAFVAVLAIISTHAPAVADTSVSHSGVTGAHHVLDGNPPRTVCTYDPVSRLITRIRSHAPQAFAVDRTSGEDHQDVAVRARAQRLVAQPGGGSAWEDRRVGSFVRLPATDTISPFNGSTEFPVTKGPWRIQWDFRWYRGHSHVVTGRSTRQADAYGLVLGQSVLVEHAQSSCPGSIADRIAFYVKHGSPTLPRVGLTFDWGGSGDGHLVRWLVDHNVAATIFVTGTAVTATQEGRDILSLIGLHRDLLDIGNHSWDHPNFNGIPDAEVATQLQRTEDAVKPIAGTTKPLFRPPYGVAGPPKRLAAGRAGWGLTVSWDVLTDDYLPVDRGGPTAPELADKVLSNVVNGSIVIMHVDGPNTLNAMPQILQGLADRGLTPVRLTELLDLRP